MTPPAAQVSWSRHGDQDCLRLHGLASASRVEVRPASAATGTAPAMAGRLVRDGERGYFVPRFPFMAGTRYTVTVDGATVADLLRPVAPHPPAVEVAAIYPSAPVVPRNLLRCYVWFTAPMSEGCAASQLRLVDESGGAMAGALLSTEDELWDAERRRLTVLLDPARIKRGLLTHRQVGYPLRTGEPFRLVVEAGFRDSRGAPLRRGAQRRYEVGGDERRLVDPAGWSIAAPRGGTREPLRVAFDRPLDHGLLLRCLRVLDPAGRPVGGTVRVGAGERDWWLAPRRPWAAGPHRLGVDPVLEDVAGNSVTRVFDRDLTRPGLQTGTAAPIELPFQPAAS
ncbi:MAG: hypothetical protein J2P15_03735 [Micromonosporaceae bacterium]|nr:hypothetical protein [Micromonosporaceae bacterium]